MKLYPRIHSIKIIDVGEFPTKNVPIVQICYSPDFTTVLNYETRNYEDIISIIIKIDS